MYMWGLVGGAEVNVGFGRRRRGTLGAWWRGKCGAWWEVKNVFGLAG